MRTTAIMNLKGGTGKTVTAINLAAILAMKHGMHVLLCDCDSQANLTEFVSLAGAGSDGGMYDLLTGSPARARRTRIDDVDLLSADEQLMSLDVTAAGNGKADPMALRDWLDERAEEYDWCVIDCPPAFSAAAMAALIAADEVVIPMKLDAFGVRGFANLFTQIRNMQKVNPGLEIAGVLPTMVSPKDAPRETELRQALNGIGVRCFHYICPTDKMVGTTYAQTPLIESSPKSKATYHYKLLARDLIAEGGRDDV